LKKPGKSEKKKKGREENERRKNDESEKRGKGERMSMIRLFDWRIVIKISHLIQVEDGLVEDQIIAEEVEDGFESNPRF
jgi:hypothetical protein